MDPRLATMLGRGLRRRCPRCGSSPFDGWFAMRAECPGCGLVFEREPGYWVGAVAVNLALVGACFVLALTIALACTVPDVPVGPVLAGTLPIVVFGPLVCYGTSRTTWVAIDRGILARLDT